MSPSAKHTYHWTFCYPLWHASSGRCSVTATATTTTTMHRRQFIKSAVAAAAVPFAWPGDKERHLVKTLGMPTSVTGRISSSRPSMQDFPRDGINHAVQAERTAFYQVDYGDQIRFLTEHQGWALTDVAHR